MSTKHKTQNASPVNAWPSKMLKWLVKTCLFLLLFVIISMAVLLTPWGAKLGLSTVDDLVDELSIDYQSGGLGSQLQLTSVTWQQGNNKINLQQVNLAVDFTCVWRLAVCIDELSIKQSDIVIANQKSGSQESSSGLITMPLPISIAQLEVAKLSLEMAEQAKVSWRSLNASLNFYQRLEIEKMHFDGLSVRTFASPTQPSQPFDWQNWQYQGIEPMPLTLPMHFLVQDLEVRGSDIHLAGQEKIHLQRINLTAKGDAKLLKVEQLVVQHQDGQAKVNGYLDLGGQFKHELSVEAAADLKAQPIVSFYFGSSGDIQSMSANLQVSQQQAEPNLPLNLALQLTAQPALKTLPLSLKANWSGLRWPLAKSEFQAKQGELAIEGDLAQLNLTANTNVSGQAVPETKANLAATAKLTEQNKTLSLDEFSIVTIGGQINTQGVLTLANTLSWQGQTQLENVEPSVFWPALDANVNGQVMTQVTNKEGTWQAKLNQLDIKGQWLGYPLRATGQANYEQNIGLNVPSIKLTSANNELSIEGQINQQKALDLTVNLKAPEIAKSMPEISGALDLTGQIRGSFSQPAMEYQVSGSELLVAGIFMQKITGQGMASWNEQKPVDLTLTIEGIQGVSNQIDSAQLALKGNGQAHQLTLNTTGLNSSIDIAIQGQLKEKNWQGQWVTGDIKSTYANLSLPKPFALYANWLDDEYRIAAHCWQHSKNSLCVKQAELKQNTAHWDVSLKQFDLLSVLRRATPAMHVVDTQSRLYLDVAGKWDLAQLPELSINGRLSQGEWVFNQQNNLQLALDDVLVKLQMTQKNVTGDVQLSGPEIGQMRINVNGQSGAMKEPLERPITGQVLIGRLDLASLGALAPQLTQLQGLINGQAQIDGTLGKPLFDGQLSLTQGSVKGESLPVALSEIEQNIILQGQSAKLNGQYRFGQGLGEMSGNISWQPKLMAEFSLSGERLEFDYQNMIKAQISPDIKVSYSVENVSISGEVGVPYTRIKVGNLPKGSVTPSDDVVLMEEQAQQQKSAQNLDLNLLVKIDSQKRNQAKLDAFGLTTDLQGQLRLYNHKADFFGNGELRLVNGRYKAYGQNLLLREGEITFTRSLDRPFVNIKAVRDPDLTADGVIAGLKVTGLAQNPDVKVFSEPALEQQEALSYMLTGRGFGQASGESEDTVLTNALLSLGLGKSENLISKVGDKLGFEDVNLDTTGQGDDTQLSLSGTIAPGVQLRYGVGVFNSISEVAIRYELWPKLYLEAVSGVSNAIDIYYQFSVEGKQNKQLKHD